MKRKAKAGKRLYIKNRAALSAAQLENARTLFREVLPLTLKRQLTIEIAKTRGAELKRAYSSIKSVTAGFRLRRGAVLDEPCVVFVVARKQPKSKLSIRTMLPKELYCYAEYEGNRHLCAVPTDVDSVRARGRITLQATQQIDVTLPAGGPSIPGVAACAIARRWNPGAAYLVSCRHVLGHANWSGAIERTQVRINGQAELIAEASLGLCGRLAEGGISCDVQLALVLAADGGREALAGANFDDYILESQAASIPKQLFILTPRGPIEVHFNQTLSSEVNALKYGRIAGSPLTIVHETLIETIFVAEGTQPGDSGSPVATAPEGGRLVGMHIARNSPPHGDGTRAYAIPSWELLSPDNYDPEEADEVWNLLGPQDIVVPASPPPQPEFAKFISRFESQFGAGANATRQEGFKALLDCCEAKGLQNKSQIAYVLASCWHETGARMQPVRETFANSDGQAIARLNDMFAKGKLKRRYWDPDPENGRSYYGRGLIQITHATNYKKLGDELGMDLRADPDLTLNMAISAQIAVVGMQKGLFTGKKLADFTFDSQQSWFRARAIVNGNNDRASEIAEFGKKFLACL